MPLKYKQVKRILADYDFVYLRQKGSHEQWIRNGKLATIPFTNEYPIKTAKSIIEQISFATDKSYKDILNDYAIKL